MNDIERIEREELGRLFGRMVLARLLFLPAVISVIAYLAYNEGLSNRMLIVCGLLLVVGSFFVFEVYRFKRSGVEAFNVDLNFAVIVVAQMTIVAVSGGIHSPFVVAAVPISVMSALFVRPGAGWKMAAFQLLALWLLAARDWSSEAATLATVDSFVIVVARVVARTVRGSVNVMVARAAFAQEALKASYSERTAELTALSGELAHELKNPLASIKGLAGLLETNVQEGKGRERLGVLKKEVERMQGILDEFLNFSRPLTPLVRAKQDLARIAKDVAQLYESSGVSVEAENAVVDCDARKVKQVLINLVQNALEAGGPVSIEVRAPGTISVRDRGPGVPPLNVFEAGVTTKATGSGLGLTISRALAVQHGGELTLQPRQGGGTVATMRLP